MKRLAIGEDADQNDEAPGYVLTSMVKHVETAVFDTIKEVVNGGWTGGVRQFGLREHGVGWIYDDRNRALIPARAKAVVDSLESEIVAGRITVPSK
jgi:basic membrane protein A